jgi:hypothetical protein
MRRRLNYANVTATLALFFAMSGGALAAKHYLINSTKQINPKVLRALKGNAGPAGPAGAAGLAGAAGKEGPQGKEGPPGKEGAAGKAGERGPSNAYTVSQTSILAFPSTSNEQLTVASLSLPAGNFVLEGKVLANNNAGAQTFAHCELLLGASVIDAGFDGVSLGKNVELDRAYLVVSGAGSLSSPGTATIVCNVGSTEGNYLQRSLTATKVASIG